MSEVDGQYAHLNHPMRLQRPLRGTRRARLSPGSTATAIEAHWRAFALVIGTVAFLLRLIPMLRGGGLYGLGNYDDGVYYGAAVGLADGHLPYRDFLLLHPPGIVLALVPFAALGRLIGDGSGMAAARVAWMVLGSANAVLVGRLLRSLGLLPALAGGLFYAFFFPAIYDEHSITLEGLGSTCLLLAMVALVSPSERATPRLQPVLVAGALLGVGAAVKIWGVVILAAVTGWLLVTQGPRRGGRLLLAALAGASAVCLPFFLSAPATMWRFVVTDQLGRAESHASLAARLGDITGLRLVDHPAPTTTMLVVGLVLFLGAAILAWTSPQGRLGVVLLASVTAMLLATPSWFIHYAGAVAGPAAVVVGAAVRPMVGWTVRRRRSRTPVAAAVLLLGLLVMSVPLTGLSLGTPFPAAQLSRTALALPGCITTDDPTTLIEMNLLTRNLERGCAFTVDLGGYSYDRVQANARPVPRDHNLRWQRHALRYLATGSATLIVRFHAGFGFDPGSATTVESWHTLAHVGHFILRRPITAP